MPEITYTVTTKWKRLRNYNKDGADNLISKISKFDKNIYTKVLNKETSVLFKGADASRATKIKSLLTNVGIDVFVEETPSLPTSREAGTLTISKPAIKFNFTVDSVAKAIFYYTRLALIFPVSLFNKLSKRKVSTKTAFTMLTIVAVLGLYNSILDVLMNPFYDLSYSYCMDSFISIETIFIISSIAKNITSISVASLTGISEFISRISGFLENSLIALTAQTVLLKIMQQGFLLKSGLTLGFGFGIFETSRKFGEKLVFFTIFIYISLPFFVAAETFIFNQVTTQQIQNINAEYTKQGGAIGLSKKAVVGISSYLYNKIQDFISGNSDTKANENVKELKSFFMTILNGIMFVLVSIIILSIAAPLVIYRLFKLIFASVIDSNLHISLFDENKTPIP
ncbi:MAG: hypothetical protein ACP59X_18250 [Solidesulfovibrio sp. DCME]|uniref:hypothetical protein n=1 Tax=Solidesulfovibrio sp. DCME TaxID=3447380 RepID=UPI003D117988